MAHRGFPPRLLLLLLALVLALLGLAAGTGDTSISVSSSRLVSPALRAWRDKYVSMFPKASVQIIEAASETSMDSLIAREVDFAISVVDFSDAEYAAQGDLQIIPLVALPVVFGYGLPNLDVPLNLSVQLIVDIWQGHVSKWNDPAILAINPGANLPNETIRVLARQGVSDASRIFTTAMSQFSSEWNQNIGPISNFAEVFNNTHRSNASFIPCSSDDDVALKISTIDYTIGYLTLAAALDDSVAYAVFVNSEGRFSPNPYILQQAMQSLTLSSRLVANVFNMPSNYPMYTMAYIGVRMNTPPDCARVLSTLRFLRWSMLDPVADQLAEDLGYIPLPPTLTATSIGKLQDMRCHNGERVLPLALTGGGATQAGFLMGTWSFSYMEDHPTLAMDFDPIGSLSAIESLKAGQFDFAISDYDLADADYQQMPSLQMIPVVISAVAVVFNLPELAAYGGSLILSREVLVGIFNGSITRWNDPAICRLNPFIHFSTKSIRFVAVNKTNAIASLMRKALNAFDPTQSIAFSGALTKYWGPAFAPKRLYYNSSHETAAAMVAATPYSIACLPFQVALDFELTFAAIRNRAGNVVTPSTETIAAAQGHDAVFSSRFTLDLVDGSGDESYPIVGFTSYVLNTKTQASPVTGCEASKALVSFVQWSLQDATALLLARKAGYVPAFGTVNPLVEKALRTFTCGGELVIPPIPESKLDLIPIVVPVVCGIALLVTLAAAAIWKIRQKLREVTRKLNDVQIAVELSVAIATLDLDKMAFLETIEKPTTTQKSCLQIYRTLKQVKKYVPQAVLAQLKKTDEEDEDEEETDAENDDPKRRRGGGDGASSCLSGDLNGSTKRPTNKWVEGRITSSHLDEAGSTADLMSVGDGTARSSLDSQSRKHSYLQSVGSFRSTKQPPSIIPSPKAAAAGSFRKRAQGGARGGRSPAAGSTGPDTRKFGTKHRASSAIPGAASIVSASSDSLTNIKLVVRPMNVLCLAIQDFEGRLKANSTATVRQYNNFIEQIYPIVNAQNGTISHFDGENLAIHWNATKRTATARLQACEVATKLLRIAKEMEFTVRIGLAGGRGYYTSIGCDSMMCFAVMGNLWNRAVVLERLNALYGTSILLDEEVKQQAPGGAAFLVDVVDCADEGHQMQRAKVYELVAEAVVESSAMDDEWLYAFKAKENALTERQKQWAGCAEAIFKGDSEKAKLLIKAYVEKYGDVSTPKYMTEALAFLTTSASATSASGPPKLSARSTGTAAGAPSPGVVKGTNNLLAVGETPHHIITPREDFPGVDSASVFHIVHAMPLLRFDTSLLKSAAGLHSGSSAVAAALSENAGDPKLAVTLVNMDDE